MKYKKSFYFLLIYSLVNLIFPTFSYAEIFTCVENGTKVIKSTESCNGKITSVTFMNGRSISYQEYLSERTNQNNQSKNFKKNQTINNENFINQKSESEYKETQNSTNLDLLKQSCASEFREFDSKYHQNKWSGRYKFNLLMLQNKCKSQTYRCYDSYDKLYQVDYDKGSNDDYVSAKQRAEIIGAECNLPAPSKSTICHQSGNLTICNK